jgi:hypothetical protein
MVNDDNDDDYWYVIVERCMMRQQQQHYRHRYRDRRCQHGNVDWVDTVAAAVAIDAAGHCL